MSFSRPAPILFFVTFALLLGASCSPQTAPTPNPANPTKPASVPTRAASPAAQAGFCANGGALAVNQDEPLAARVNDQPISLAVYERQAKQSEVALVQQGMDPNSADGKEAIKGLRTQALSQLIDDVLVEQAARAQKLEVSANDINDRVQQVINEAGSKEKFDQYLQSNQLTLEDLCQQIRANLFGEVLIERLTSKLPTRVEQVHIAHILFAKKEDAEQALAKLQAGTDFGTLAKQVSQDEATRDNGGEMGWFPRDVLPTELEQAAFALRPGQVSGIVSTQLGLHIVKLLGRDNARALSPELIQNQRLAAFNQWLVDQRAKAKIETFVKE